MINISNSYQDPSFTGGEHGLVRLIHLAQRTGDTLIVTDAYAEHPVAIVPMQRYEQLVGIDESDSWSDEEGMWDEDWSEDSEEPVLEAPESIDQLRNGLTEEPKVRPIREMERDFIPEMHEAVPAEVPMREVTGENPLTPEDDPSGEEQFYLEPIE